MSTRPKIFHFIFIPALLLSVILAGSSALFHLAQDILLVKIGGVYPTGGLKEFVVFPQILLVLVLLIASKKKSFEKVFQWTLIALMGVVLLVAGLAFFQAHLPLKETAEALRNLLPSSMVQTFEPAITNWPQSLLYIVINLLSVNLFSVLIWGFINRLTLFSEGIKYYIPLALVIGIPSALLGLGLGKRSLIEGGFSDRSLILIGISAIALVIVALLIFNRAWKRLPDHFLHPKDPVAVPKKRFPFLTAAYLLAGCVIVGSFMHIGFISDVRNQFSSNVSAYSQFMGNYLMARSLSTLILFILWVALGTWLILKRGWKTTALWGSLSVLIGGLIYLGFSAIQSVSWLGHGIFNGLFLSAKTALFFPLIQIAYLYLPFQSRFRAKVVTEMIALPLMTGASSLMIQWLIVAIGSMSVVSIYLKTFIPILLVLLVIASRRLGSRLPAK